SRRTRRASTRAFRRSAPVAPPRPLPATTRTRPTGPRMPRPSSSLRRTGGGRRQRALGAARLHGTYAEVGQRDRVTLPGLLDALDRELAVAQVIDVRHQERETGLRDEVQPFALCGLVGRFRHADVERHLRVLVHAGAPCPGPRRGSGAAGRSSATAAASAAAADAAAAARFAGLRIGEVDRRVVVDLLAVDALAEAIGPLA